MAEKNRNFSIYLLILALVGAAVFYGCGSATSDAIPAIEYQITGRYNSEFFTTQGNSSARAAQNYTYGPNDNIYIYSESDPSNYADIDRDESTYVLKNLKPGKHYIVFKHVPAGLGNDPMYIVRSTKPVVLTDSLPVQQLNEALNAAKGTVSITGKLLNPSGQPISPTPNLYLWGQKIDVDPITGQFTTPKMPKGTTADLIVNAVNYKETTNTVTFTENPAYQEMTAVPTTAINEAPTIDLSSKQSDYLVNSLVIVTATVDAKNNQQIEFEPNLECSIASAEKIDKEKYEETIKNGKYIRKYYWNAPSEDCVATISVKVTEKATGLSSTAKVQVAIGTGQYIPNHDPIIISTSIYPEEPLYGSREYTVTCIATDSDNDTLNYSLTVDPSTGSTIHKAESVNSWVWTTPDIDSTNDYNLIFQVRDPKGKLASYTRPVKVGESRPNEPPTIVERSTSPDSNIITSGTDITFFVKASDPENGKLSFTWTSKKGEIKSFSDDGHTASMTWRAPYVNNNTDTEIACKIIDQFKSFVVATFSLTIKQDPNHKAPEVKLAIGGTSDFYQGNIPLFKAGDQVSLVGIATDLNQNTQIESKNYCWFITNPNGSTNLIQNTNTATYTIPLDSVKGDYSVRLTAVDYSNITGEEVADFRINTIPVTEIQCNGAMVDSNTGRMSPKSEHDYKTNSKTYDVFQLGETINLVASCSDVETNQTYLDNNANWLLNSYSYTGKNYNAELTTKGLNTLTLTTIDSKGESSATSTYQFFVNTPPVFDLATSTKSGFINTDVIKLNAKVTDDANGLTLTWLVSYKADGSSEFSEYKSYDLSGTNPVQSNSNTLTSNIEVNASTLLTLGKGFKFKLIASDSMGTQTVNEDIEFSVVESHKIEPFEVASGGYDINVRPYTFDELLPALSEPYDFEAKQKFSIRSGSDIWQDAMTWTWYDSFWTNNTPGTFKKIADSNVDGYTLNGYAINDEFGTHTIRLEGKSNEYGIVASRSIDIFVNSTPKISFNNMVDGTIRFDSGSNATFTITLKEDNRNEKLGLIWTIYDLQAPDCKVVATHTYESHDLDQSTGNKSPVDMAGSNEKNVTVTWKQITNDTLTTLTKGAKRVCVCAYDDYGKAATASVDILVNTLPKFEDVLGTTKKIKITRPDTSDNGEDYSDLPEQYATIDDIPVFLIAENPSMQLDFEVNATDEDGNVSEDNIIWKYTAYGSEGATASETGSLVKARFGIGLNTINVEIRDDLYDKYKKDGVAIYNHMCIATYSADFYIWHSMAWQLYDNEKTATALYNAGGGVFYVQYGNNENNFAERYQLRTGANPTLPRLIPGHVKPEIYLNGIDGVGNPVVIGTYTPKIITFIQSAESKFLMLTNSTDTTNLAAIQAGAESVRYNMIPSDEEIQIPWLASYTIVKIDNPDKNTENKAYNSFALPERITLSKVNTSPNYPGDNKFPEKILSMTYSDTEPTAGAMILKGWNTHPDGAIAAFSNVDYCYDAENTSPLHLLDNSQLNLSLYSKIRYLPQLSSPQKLFVTDTNNRRIVRLKYDFSNASSIPATYPIDVCMTKSKYVFSLAEKEYSANDDAIALYSIDDNNATLITSFAKFITQPTQDSKYNKKRAGKVINPKSIIYYTSGSGNDIFGGLIILEEGSAPGKNRIQVIRSNKDDWLE